MSAKSCRKGNHEVDEPVFTDPVLGGLIGWKCSCGFQEEKPGVHKIQVGVKRHGYYIASQDLMGGNTFCAVEAKAAFLNLELPMDKDGKHQGSRFDSCSVFQTQGDIVITRISLINFFDPEFKIVVHDK